MKIGIEEPGAVLADSVEAKLEVMEFVEEYFQKRDRVLDLWYNQERVKIFYQ